MHKHSISIPEHTNERDSETDSDHNDEMICEEEIITDTEELFLNSFDLLNFDII